MTRILQLVPTRKGAYRRAKGKTSEDPKSQLSLFAARSAQVVALDSGLTPFEEALLLDRTGREGAREAYVRAHQRGDRPADAACNLGILEAGEGAYDDAIEWFAKSLELRPDHFEAHYNLGCLYLDMELYAPARVHLAVAAVRDADNAELQFNLAVALAGVGQLAASASALRRFRKLSGGADQDDNARRLLGQLEQALRERAIRE